MATKKKATKKKAAAPRKDRNFHLNGIRGAIMAASKALVDAIDRQTTDNGKWLAEIAEAIAEGDPETLKELAAKLRSAKGDLKASVDANQE